MASPPDRTGIPFNRRMTDADKHVARLAHDTGRRIIGGSMMMEQLINRARSMLFYKGEEEVAKILAQHTSPEKAYLATKAAGLMNGYWLTMGEGE